MKNHLTSLHLLLIVLLGGLVYANTFGVPFVLDDLESIVANESIRDLGNFLPGGSGLDFHFRRFVAYFTFALNYHFGALAVGGYHLFNLVIHLGSALLVYALVRLLFRTPILSASRLSSQAGTLALLAALFFVAHPLQTQAITYIVQRLTSLCSFFYLLAIVLYLLARLALDSAWQRDARRPGLTAAGRGPLLLLFASLVATILAMFTKEIAFTLPLAMLLVDVAFFPGSWRQRLLPLTPFLLTLPIIPLLVAAGGEVSTAGTLVRSSLDIPRGHYLLTQLPVLVTCLRLLLLPVGQNLDYDYSIATSLFAAPVLLSLVLLTALLLLAVYLYGCRFKGASARRLPWPDSRLIAFGIFWFFLTIAIESSVVPLPDVIFEHRLYLPSVGVAIALAAAIVLAMQASATLLKGRLPLLLAGVAIVALGAATWQRNQVWRSELTLWADTVQKSPAKVRPLYNYGYYLTESGRVEEAVVVLNKVVALDAQHADAWHNLGRAYLLLNRDREALPALRNAVRLAPTLDLAVLNLSSALLRNGQPAEAVPLLESVRQRAPNWPEVRFSLGLAYVGMGALPAARSELVELQRLNPNLARTLSDIINRAATP